MLAPACTAIDTRQPAPKFQGKTLDGERFDNQSLKGKVVLLQAWTTWCGYCRREQPILDALLKEFKPKGLVILAVNVGEDRAKVKGYLERSPRACKVVLSEDTNLASMFPGNGFPQYVLIDRESKVVDGQEGAGGESALRELLRQADLV